MGEKTTNIPPEWESTVAEAIKLCDEARASKVKTDEEILTEVYSALQEKIATASADESKFLSVHQEYVANGLFLIVKHALKLTSENRPTHRKGYGEAGTEETDKPPILVWSYGSGGGDGGGGDGGSTGDGGGVPPPTDGGDQDSPYSVPGSEEARARQALGSFSIRPYEDPLPFVRRVAQALGGNWGLNGKRGDPNNPSKDILAYRLKGGQPQLYDVLIDAGGKNKITWSALRYPQSAGAVWIAP